jgi:ABC-type transport system substrate-binding protein
MLGGDPDPEDLDPATTYGSAQGYVGHLYSGLVRLSPQLQIEPDLAGEWDISPDGRVYTFTLRSGLTFQSGDPLTAEAVRASWERAADPDIESPTAATYLGDILGVKDKLAGEAESIAGLSVVDDRTLVVTLDAPKPYFLAKLTYPTAYVVNPRAVDEGGARWMFEPDASGPYALREYNAGSSILFERNPAYYQPPAIQYIAYTFYPGGSGISLYEAGQIDILFIGALDAAHVREPDDPLHAEWQSVPSLCTSFLMFDNHKPPLDDVNVRKALMLALDRDTLIERFTENLDLRADTILPPAMPGHSDEFPLYKFDVAAARQALAESKYADNLPALVLNERGSGDEASDFLTAVAEMWRENLGLEVSIEFLDPRDYTRAAREQHGHAVTYGWCADYPDPENFLDVLFHSASDFNVAAYSNPDVDALLEEARTELDPARRLDLYHQAETLILEDAGALPWQHSIFDVLVKPRINGYVISPMHTAFVHLLSFEAP